MRRFFQRWALFALVSHFCLIGGVLAAEGSGSPGWMRLVLVNVSTYELYQEVQSCLKSGGLLSQIIPRAASKNLYEFDIMSSVSPEVLAESLKISLAEKATVEFKLLPIGISEISITRQNAL